MKIPYGKNYIKVEDIDINSANCKILLPDMETLQICSQEKQTKLLNDCLNNPLDGYGLKNWYNAGDKLAVIVPDITRNCSQSIILYNVIGFLENIGLKNNNDLQIIIAVGNHRLNSELEIRKLVGDYIYKSYPVKNHNSIENLTYMGTSSRGNKVFLNSDAVNADKVLVIGGINYHNFAGISGGRKSILPGIAGKETIYYNHQLMVDGESMHEKCQLGCIESNPIHEDMLEAVKMLDPEGNKIYCVNVVSNMYGQIISAYAGKMKDVFDDGVKFMRKKYQIKVENKADIVIGSAGGYPYDINYYQAFKSLYSASKIVKPGGYLFLLAECSEGFGESYEKFKFWFSKSRKEVIRELGTNFDMVGQIAYWTIYAMENFKLYIVVDEKNLESFRSLAFPAIVKNEFYGNLKKALSEKDIKTAYISLYSNITYLSLKDERI